MVVLMRKMHAIMELLEWDNKDLQTVFEEVIAVELIDITKEDDFNTEVGFEKVCAILRGHPKTASFISFKCSL